MRADLAVSHHDPHAGRVLIVEDESFVAMDNELTLRAAGFEPVGIATTASEAVSLALERRPDVVLMDIRLAGVRSGIDAAAEILERTGIRSIFSSAYSDELTRQRARIACPVGWLIKPYSAVQLVFAVSQALSRSWRSQ